VAAWFHWKNHPNGGGWGWKSRCHEVSVPQDLLKTAEKGAAKSSLTPCILDDDPAQLEMLAALITDIGYEPITTSSPEEA